jgi:hypothetical protein
VKDSLDEVRTTDALTVVVTEARSQLIEALNGRLRRSVTAVSPGPRFENRQ